MFEGSEKKVEIITAEGQRSLRMRREEWYRVVEAARASVLSVVHGRDLDAYLLSESSLFVFDNAAIMITCGTTTLIEAIEEMLRFIPIESVRLLMYERKNELAPEAQHTSFEDDVARIEALCPGEALTMGDLGENHIRLFHYRHQAFTAPADDMTLEILMHDLSPRTRELFHEEVGREGIYAATGVNHILPDFRIDDHVFSPVGYSLNAVSDNAYYTFHVTPEQVCSYASLETNAVFSSNAQMMAVIEKVLGIFEPGSASVILFHNHGLSLDPIVGYTLDHDTHIHRYGYDIHFWNLIR